MDFRDADYPARHHPPASTFFTGAFLMRPLLMQLVQTRMRRFSPLSFLDLHGLEVRQPAAPGLVMGVADVVPGSGTFATD